MLKRQIPYSYVISQIPQSYATTPATVVLRYIATGRQPSRKLRTYRDHVSSDNVLNKQTVGSQTMRPGGRSSTKQPETALFWPHLSAHGSRTGYRRRRQTNPVENRRPDDYVTERTRGGGDGRWRRRDTIEGHTFPRLSFALSRRQIDQTGSESMYTGRERTRSA